MRPAPRHRTIARSLPRRDRRRVLMLALPFAMLALLVPVAALAHPGHAEGGALAAGLVHPLGGVDHLVAMLAVGLMAGVAGGRAALVLPLVFLGAMAAGGLGAMAGLALPLVEPVILASCVVLGAVLVLALRPALWQAAPVVALFGAAHGAAHGAEAPAGAAAGYALGFLIATAGLHAAGWLVARHARPALARIAGGAAIAAGAALAFA